jgi:chromosome segregation ATPase
MLNGLSFLLLISVAGMVWFARAWRQAEKRSLDLAGEVAALEGERKDLIRRGDHESQARKKQSEELAELRRRADKAKRRAEKLPEAPLGTAARIRDVEVELERAQTALRRVEFERDQHARSAATLQTERDRLAKQLEDASAPARAVAEQGRVALERAESELAAMREQYAKQVELLGLARQTEVRIRKRMDNQEQLYASLRAELDVKKDRLRAQEEQIQRLQALKAAVIDSSVES